MGYSILIFLLYWIVLSERFTLEGILTGSFIAMFVIFINKALREDYKPGINFNLKKMTYGIKYILILIKEVIIANINVAKVILSPALKISPVMIKIKTDIKSEFLKTLYCNSITLTPGTITVMTDKDTLLIHCLKEDYAKGLQNSEMKNIIARLEGNI
ncbi:Na(+)/H(+) antiporter subunit E [Oxobacter pfennigii]|uniref:Na(+)/H(+) antiporter subunit E n=1 Tax=Oxobacter pfennigii TaxID=36849 RepID=A0A0P8W3X1_9CLOT|nr:Na+/H+ antiporter subunit E [Oxobacter pfennigii]KPU42307.1 Na(+)/H(+) antiporter subunit E [Oxobacter pfennigii]